MEGWREGGRERGRDGGREGRVKRGMEGRRDGRWDGICAMHTYILVSMETTYHKQQLDKKELETLGRYASRIGQMLQCCQAELIKN